MYENKIKKTTKRFSNVVFYLIFIHNPQYFSLFFNCFLQHLAFVEFGFPILDHWNLHQLWNWPFQIHLIPLLIQLPNQHFLYLYYEFKKIIYLSQNSVMHNIFWKITFDTQSFHRCIYFINISWTCLIWIRNKFIIIMVLTRNKVKQKISK